MTAVIEQWRETLALAHQNAEAGIDIEAVLSMALLPSVSPQNGSHSDDMAGSNDNDLSVAAFEDKPNEIKLNISVAGVALPCGAKAGLNIECGDCELAFIEN